MTIPGYSPLPIDVQSHIHLGLVPAGGGAPSGLGAHNEPPYTFYHISDRTPILSAQDNFVRANDGTPHDHAVRDANGYAVVYEDLRYVLRVSATDIECLKRLYKNRVYLVDNRHCGAIYDHAPYTRIMYFAGLEYDRNYDPQLLFNDVTLTFKDGDTVDFL